MRAESDTAFLLIMQFNKRNIIPLSELLPQYLPHLTIEQAKKRANKCALPFPAFKLDGHKSDYFVNLYDIAYWLDSLQKESKQDWHAMNTE